MSKLTIFGSSRMDSYLDLPEEKAETVCDIDTEKCFLELSYSSKIPLEGVQFLIGGNGANVAVGTKRFGVESTLVSELGVGIMADSVKKTLEDEGVEMTHVTQSPEITQGFGAIIRYRGERTILSYYSPHRPPFPANLEKTDWAYLTSVGDKFEEFYEDIRKWLTGGGMKLAFNPGGRQISKGKEWMGKYLALTEILIVNREEGEGISGFTGSHNKEKDLIKAITAIGPKMVIITDGMNGTFAYDGKDFLKIGILPIAAKERTGAGDAFSTGILAALTSGKTLADGMLWGTLNSTSVIGYVGPQKGLIYAKDLPVWEARAKKDNISVTSF